MDVIEQRMRAIRWNFAEEDPAALSEIESRLADAGANLQLVRYSDLAQGVAFRLPNVRNGEQYEIQVHHWTGFDRMLIGEFLGRASMNSYLRHGFMASALAVDGAELRPSWHFFDWMEQLGVLRDTNEDTVLAFWAEQVNRAHSHFSRGRR